MTILINVIGWIAVVIGASMYAPQSIKVIKSKSAKGLSKISFTLAAFGNGMWLIYMGSLGDFLNTSSGWSVNVIVGVMMLPILYYIYKDKLWVRILFYAWFLFTFSISLYLELKGESLASWEQISFVVLAGGTTSFGFIPQIIKILKTKKTDNLSLLLVSMYATVNALWTIYWALMLIYKSDSDSFPGEMVSIVLDGGGFLVQFYLGYLAIKYKSKA